MYGFRPLSLETFFQLPEWERKYNENDLFSSPFLGTFFQSVELAREFACTFVQFSSPFSGTFFQFHFDLGHQVYHPKTFSSPFSETFFQ